MGLGWFVVFVFFSLCSLLNSALLGEVLVQVSCAVFLKGWAICLQK